MKVPPTEAGQIAKYGTRVFVPELLATDFVEPNDRRRHAKGFIVGHHNSCGLCYRVLQSDHTIAGYEARELRELEPDTNWVEMWMGLTDWYRESCFTRMMEKNPEDQGIINISLACQSLINYEEDAIPNWIVLWKNMPYLAQVESLERMLKSTSKDGMMVMYRLGFQWMVESEIDRFKAKKRIVV